MSQWRCSWQDYTHWRTTDFEEPHPPVMYRDFETRELAELEQKLRQSLGMTACVSPTPPPKRRKIVGQESWT
jgi:hypothetical protein